MNSLQNSSVWITGAGSGIGQAVAIAFGRAGARVALTGRRIEALAKTASLMGDVAVVVPGDMTSADDVSTAYQAVCRHFGEVNVLVNNAGRNSALRHFNRLTVEEMSSLLDVNLRAAFLCSMAVIPAMRERRSGTLIHVGSMAATMIYPTAGAAYAAAKAAVRQMSAHLNAEEGIHGIRSVCLNPGEVATEIMAARPTPPSPEEQSLMLQPEDVAAAVLFVAGLPLRVTVSELTIVPTNNQAWRAAAQRIAENV